MRIFKRRYNPIFIEEERREWERRHRSGPKILFIVITFAIVMSTLYLFLQ
ncbi:MAG: hypothetical protein Q8L60_08300 [Gammaproteobacteria bacterium]|nr:hypothetical protein [Gammaproteobacteria bacterium]MDP2140021.1 hypothetical protein [Gammaproteobacteria bacterium]MDP2347837.1 hypothetical protein [Gammaproteobacteria bacterium]